MSKISKAGDRRRRNPKTARRRNYAAEYRRRIQRGLAKGLSRAGARGHPRAGERLKAANPVIVNPKSREERAIAMMKGGASLRSSARQARISEERLRAYVKEHAGAAWNGKRWTLDDRRGRRFPVYSGGELKTLLLWPGEASRAASFMHAVREFLPRGDPSILAPYVGQGVTDIRGRFHPFETDPDRLYQLDAAGELNFPEFYRIVA